MKKIGLLFGNEMDFSQAVIKRICDKNIPNVTAESICIGALDTAAEPDYSVVLDMFSHYVPFYKSILKYFKHCGVKIVNAPDVEIANEEFSYLTMLNKLKINVPKTAIFPSKQLPYGVNGNDLHNLQYPLDWSTVFQKIGFPANIKSNHSSEFYDCFKVYNENDFHFIYDMSGTNTLILQEYIETENNFRLFIVGNKRMLLKYEQNKAPIDRYSIADVQFDKKTDSEIDKIINLINENYAIDMYILDIAVAEKVYVLNISLFTMNINNLIVPKDCYDWLVEETSNLLIDKATNSESKKATVATTKKSTTSATVAKSKSTATTATAKKKTTTSATKKAK
jgi:hypothetical protein